MRQADDLIRDAYAALLRGDTAERDRLCGLAMNVLNAGERTRAGGSLMVGEPIKVRPPVIALPDRSGETVQ